MDFDTKVKIIAWLIPLCILALSLFVLYWNGQLREDLAPVEEFYDAVEKEFEWRRL